MKKIYLTAFLSVLLFTAFSQQAFWTETFGTGCNSGQGASVVATPSNGAWATTSFSLPFMNGPDANEWFISSSEQGQPATICGGITCGGSNNRTLHIGRNVTVPTPVVDVGASYYGGFMSFTNKRAETPVIDCSGKKFIQLSFMYIQGGVPNSDYCDLECSADGGATWTVVTTIPPTNNTGCGSQGKWWFHLVGLPASCSNNNNVKIGFHWYNNDPAGGSPSIAIDEIQLSELITATTLSVDCLNASATASITNNAISNSSYTWTSIPNTVTFTPVNSATSSIQYPGMGSYSLFCYGGYSTSAASSTAMNVVNVGFVSTNSVSATSSSSILCTGQTATITASNATTYTWNTSATTATLAVSPTSNTTYTVTGSNGFCVSTFTIEQVVDPCTSLNEISSRSYQTVFPNPFVNELNFVGQGEAEITMKNTLGEIVTRAKFNEKTTIHTGELPTGIYFVKFKTEKGTRNFKMIKY